MHNNPSLNSHLDSASKLAIVPVSLSSHGASCDVNESETLAGILHSTYTTLTPCLPTSLTSYFFQRFILTLRILTFGKDFSPLTPSYTHVRVGHLHPLREFSNFYHDRHSHNHHPLSIHLTWLRTTSLVP